MGHADRFFGCRLLLATAMVLTSAPAQGAGRHTTSALGWARLPGAESCILSADLARAVEQRLGRAAFVSPVNADVLIEGRIEPEQGAGSFGVPGFRAYLTVMDATGTVLGTRELKGPGVQCRQLDDQLALVIALFIDPEASLRPPASATAATPSALERVIVRVPTPPAPPPAEEAWQFTVLAGASVTAGLMPNAGLAFALRSEVIPPGLFPFEFGVHVGADSPAAAPPQAAKDVGSTTPMGARVSLSTGFIGACPLTWSVRGTQFATCMDLELGAVRFVGYGFPTNSNSGEEKPAISGAVVARVRRRLVGPLTIAAGLGMIVSSRVGSFYVDLKGHDQELFTTKPLAASVDAALGMTFP